MIIAAQHSQVVIDTINGMIVDRLNGAPARFSGYYDFLTITGWAVDKRVMAPFASIRVRIGQTFFPVIHQLRRPDVVACFKSDSVMMCGFSIDIPSDTIPYGDQIVSLFLVAQDGASLEGIGFVRIFRKFKHPDILAFAGCELRQLFTSPKMFWQRGKAAWSYITVQGIRSFWAGYLQRMMSQEGQSQSYRAWVLRQEAMCAQKAVHSGAFAQEPVVSIIVPLHQTPLFMFQDLIRSVQAQIYSRWELCLACTETIDSPLGKQLEQLRVMDPRIKVCWLKKNAGISGNSNAAIALASGVFVGFLDHDDMLSPDALLEMVYAINAHDDVDMLYSDEDILSSDGRMRQKPYFKPDFSPDTLRTGNYLSHFLVVRKSFGDTLGWLRPDFDGAQDYDLVLRASEKARRIVHVPQVLYHWRAHGGSTALGLNVKPYAHDAGTRALQAHLQRVGLDGEVKSSRAAFIYEVDYVLPARPLVSIIILNKDQANLLRACVGSILANSTYENYEIVIIENGSSSPDIFSLYAELSSDPRVKIFCRDQVFNFSALNNFACTHAKGDVFLFLNNDTDIISKDWIERMLQYAMRQDVGAVGAKLYYPDKTVQHAGVIIGLGSVAGHVLKGHRGDDLGLFTRLGRVQNYSAVTAACLMMRRDVFELVGGFNENLPIAFNDVDLCLKVRQKGYLVVWTPYAELIHHESKTRGYEDTPQKQARFSEEIQIFKERWGDFLAKGDPYYNPNLTLAAEDFSIKNI